jgi:pimeloyl-ACP methyl ester carboxylesterase
MSVEQRLVELADGRVLDVRVSGPRDGIPLVAHHGTPSSARQFEPYAAAAAERGLRLVTYSRPGYVSSTRAPGRSVADCAGDVAAVADHLGADRFYTTGQSGGGPHALACAALLPDRVIACAATASAAPFDAAGLEWHAGMAAENLEETRLALEGEEALVPYLEQMASAFRDLRANELASGLGDLVSAVDVETLGGAFGVHAKAMLEESVSTGLAGWVDDDVALLRPWGFEVSAIQVPVSVWHGGHDHAVPFAHGEWLAAHVPRATAHLFPDQGHLSLIVAAFPAVLDELLRGS